MIGYAPEVFYALSVKEWNAALRAHLNGDGHAKTHKLLAQLIANFVNAHSVKRPSPAKADDYLPWLRPKPKKKPETRAEWRARMRELRQQNAAE